MTLIEMKRDFKEKSGYTRIIMQAVPYEYYEKCIKYKCSYCYPANQEGKFVEYVQETKELTREEANKTYLMLKNQDFKVVKGW